MAMPISDPTLRAFADALADRYEALEPLGGGGMADLLVGRERKLDRRAVSYTHLTLPTSDLV